MIRVTKKVLKILDAKQKKMLIVLGIMMLIGGVMESISVSLMLPLITAVMDSAGWRDTWYAALLCDTFHITNQKSYVIFLLLILILIFILKNVYLIIEYYVQFGYVTKNRVKLQRQLMHSYTHKPYVYYLNVSTGEIVRIVTTDTNQAFYLITNILTFYTEMIVSIVLGITVIALSWQIGVGLIIMLSIEVAIIAKIVKPILKRQGDLQRREGSLENKWLLQSINGIKSIKVSNRESFFEEKYGKHADVASLAESKQLTLNAMPRLIIEAFTVAGVFIVLLIMILAGTSIESIIPQLSAFAVAAIRLLPTVNHLSAIINQTPFLEGGLDNVINTIEIDPTSRVYDIKSSSLSDAKSISNDSEMIAFQKEIRFENISFSYPNSEKCVLKDASFSILPGQSVGVIGTSGAGKTTAMDILLGLLEPQSGRVLIDGVDIRENMVAWRNLLAYIPQSIFLMDDTIRENVAFGVPSKDIDDARVWQALSDAQLEELVKEMPEGLDTVIGEAGIRLSGGQRQRLGIARALYNNPEILFFDEATSALDNETEAAIMDSINSLKGRKTLVIIAHRLTTIENCDTVYRVGKGKVTRER